MAGSSAGAADARRGFAHWLVDTGALPASIRLSLLRSLYGSLGIYFGGVLATVSVSMILAARIGTPVFYFWAALELAVAIARLPVLLACRRAVRDGKEGPAAAYAWLSVLWAGGVGFGAFIAVDSRDWLAAMAACVSSAAMLGGICFRYFAAPRLVLAMLAAMALPAAAACLLSGEPVLILSGLLIPIYVGAMANAAGRMYEMMVKALCAERDEAERARRDSLTGLLNRAGFSEAFAALPPERGVACFFIDLDGFKRVNDTLGHQAGDALLTLVAARLRAGAGADAILGRPGGDEFMAAMPCPDVEQAEQLGAALASAIAGQPYIVDGQGVFIGASIGAALRPEHGDTFEALVAAADDALYRAKASALSCCIVAGAADGELVETPVLIAFG